MIITLLIFTYISSFGYSHLFVPYSPQEDILSKSVFTEITEKHFGIFSDKIIPEEENKSFFEADYVKWISDSKLEKVSIYFNKPNILFSFKYFDFGEFEYHENPSDYPVLKFRPFAYKIELMPVLFYGKIPFSVSFNYSEERALEYKSSALTFDLYAFIYPYKILKSSEIKNIFFEIGVNNIGTKPRYKDEFIRLPVNMQIKGMFYLKRFGLIFRLSYIRGLWKSVKFYNGYWLSVEKDIKSFITLFAGFGKKDDIGRFGIGFELRLKDYIRFNYSYRPSNLFEDLSFFSLKLYF